MAYNNMFPIGYQPMNYQPMNYTQPQYNNQLNQQTQNSNGLIWVQGIEGAKSYLVAPNTTVQLWDSENQVIYLKSADASGMPSMKVLDYKIRDMQQAQAQPVMQAQPDYVTREELAEFKAQILRRLKNGQSVVSDDESAGE